MAHKDVYYEHICRQGTPVPPEERWWSRKRVRNPSRVETERKCLSYLHRLPQALERNVVCVVSGSRVGFKKATN